MPIINYILKMGKQLLKIKNTAKVITLTLLILICIGITYYCHFIKNIEIVFTHFFYVPIVYTAFLWGKRSIWLAVFLSIWLIASHNISNIGASSISDYLRSGMFVAVSFVVGILRERNLKIQQNLQKTRDYLDTLIHYANAPIMVWDNKGKITLVNTALEHITGYSEAELIGKPLTSIFYSRKKKKLLQKIEKILNGKHWDTEEILIIRKDSNTRLILWNSANIYAEDGTTLLSTIAQGQDITERKKAEESTKLAHTQLNQIFNTAADGMRVIDKDFTVLRINDTFSTLTKINKDNTVGKKCYDMITCAKLCHTPDCPLTQILHHKKRVECEVIVNSNDGMEIPCILTATPFQKPNGKLIGIVEDFKDITERKRSEEELATYRDHLEDLVEERTDALKTANKNLQCEINERQQTAEKLRETRDYLENLINYANAPIIVWDPEFRISQFNHAIERLTGYKTSEVIGQKLHMIFPDSSREESLDKIERALSGEYWESVEIPILRKDGNIRLVLWNSANIYVQDGETLIATIAQGQDITERKHAEEQIRTSLTEKEVLLKEIHHRVKNNLQVISSLLNLQIGYIKDKQSLEIFKESQNRVKSMALIHEKLYQSKDMAKIDFSEYVQGLTVNLFRAYGVSAETITLKINVTNVLLGIDTAIPCGLIINELISNSLKHAFPENKKGEIGINLRLHNNIYTVIISDNGIGFPKNLDFRKTETLGFQLVITLVNQLKGTISLDRNNKTEFKIVFTPLKKV